MATSRPELLVEYNNGSNHRWQEQIASLDAERWSFVRIATVALKALCSMARHDRHVWNMLLSSSNESTIRSTWTHPGAHASYSKVALNCSLAFVDEQRHLC